MTVSTIKMTARQYLMLGEDPPGVRLELVDGEVIVSPSPTLDHQYTLLALGIILGPYVRRKDLGQVIPDMDAIFTEFDVRRPDLFYFRKDRLHLIGGDVAEAPPDLCVEVISPSSIKVDRKEKFDFYRECGVPFYWINDPIGRTMEGFQLRKGRYVLTGKGGGDDLIHLPPFPDLDIPLAELWRPRGPRGKGNKRPRR